MCTMIVTQVAIEGSGKGANGWFKLRQANVWDDHPFEAPLEHALNIDFVNEALGPGARAAEMIRAAGRGAFMPASVTRVQRAGRGKFQEGIMCKALLILS